MSIYVLVILCLATISKLTEFVLSEDYADGIGNLFLLSAFVLAIIFQSINL